MPFVKYIKHKETKNTKLTIEFSKDEILNLQEGADAEYPNYLMQVATNMLTTVIGNNVNGSLKKITIEEA